MRDRTRSLALVVLLLVSTLAGVVSPVAAGGPPSGMVAVSSTNIEDIRPSGVEVDVTAADLDGAVYVSDYAATTEVDIVTSDQASEVAKGASPSDVAHEAVCSSPAAGKNPRFDCAQDSSLALVISDEVQHDGREVAVRVDVLEKALGYVPEQLVISNNETGETWQSPATVRDGWLVADVEHFSSNAVSFEGTVSVNANPAQDGDSFSYELRDLDAASDPQGTLTGVEATEWDNVSASGLGDGDTLSVDPAGHKVRGPAAGDPKVVLVGEGFSRDETATGTVAPSGTTALHIDGNLDPNGPSANGEPTIEVTANRLTDTEYDTYDDVSYFVNEGYGPYEHGFRNPPDSITGFSVNTQSNQGLTINVRANVGELPDGVGQEGTLVLENYDTSNGLNNVQFDQPVDTSGANRVTLEIEVVSGTGYVEANRDKTEDYTFFGEDGNDYTMAIDVSLLSDPQNVQASADDGTSVSFGNMADGETATKEFDVTEGATQLDVGADGGQLDYTLTYTERGASEDPALDLDGDGADEVSYAGILMDGETRSYAAPSLDPSDDVATVSTANGSTVAAVVRLEEVVESSDQTVEVNGELVASHSGTLTEGETVNYSVSESVLQNGTNTVNVSVGDGSLSSDAPTPVVGLDYTHDAKSTHSVNYSAEALSVRYEVGKQFASDQSDLKMNISFANDVYAMRDVEKQVNNGDWTGVSSSDYRITDANKLVVDVGDVSENDTVEVRANGSRVHTHNMSISVEEPTLAGNSLDSQIVIDSTGENPHMTVAGSGESKQFVYPTNESWDAPDGYAVIQANGQQDLYLPNAPDGGSVRVQTLPVEVAPNSGDVRVSVSEPRQEEPQFYVEPGASSGDTVEFTYLNANDDTKYLLYSKSNGVVRDSGTANSPVTLTDDDSEERLVFRVDDSGSSEPPTGDDFDFPPPSQFAKQTASSGGNFPLVLLVSGLGIAVLWFARSRFSGAGGVKGLFGRALSSNVVLGSLVVAVVGVGAAVGGVSLPPGAGLLLLVTGVPLATYLGLRRVGQYSHIAFGAVTVVALVLGLQLLGGDVVGQVLGNLGPSMPIFAIGGLYVLYKAVEAYRAGKTVNLSVRGFRRRSSNDEGRP
jgi:hypothetical protein